MRMLIKSFVVLIFISTFLYAGMDGSVVEVRGKVKSYNSKYVYLKFKGKKTVAPIKFVSRKQLKSKKEIRIFIPTDKYFAMLRQMKKRKK